MFLVNPYYNIKFYNSTIARWDASAALLGANHDRITLLYLVRTNVSGDFPLGLMQPGMPTTLVDFEFCLTNLTSLPGTLADAWNYQLSLTLEASGLTKVPPVVAQLKMITFSLAGNAITTFPDDLFVVNSTTFGHFAQNSTR